MTYKLFKILTIVIAVFVYPIILHSDYTAACAQNASVKRNQIEVKRQVAKREIHRLKLLEKIETKKLYKNQQKLERTAQSLNQNKAQLVSTQDEIVHLQRQLERLLVNYKEQRHATNKRIIQIFKTQRKSYVEFLLGSSDLNNFMDRIYFENLVMKSDKKKIRDIQIKTRKIQELRRQIEIQRSYLASSIKSMDRQQKNIQSAIDQNERLIYKLKTDRATWEKSEKDLARQSRAIAEMINKTTKKVEKTEKITVTGGFLRPIYGPVTSPYGWRMHPIFKKNIYHSGVDIGAPYGANVKAANSGKVIFVGWYGGYGKVVIIDHGRINGVPTTTLYAHLSSYRVRTGSSVYKGQVIANVGTTGYSTGPHLHFEVRKNGNPTNPFNFVPR